MPELVGPWVGIKDADSYGMNGPAFREARPNGCCLCGPLEVGFMTVPAMVGSVLTELPWGCGPEKGGSAWVFRGLRRPLGRGTRGKSFLIISRRNNKNQAGGVFI